MPPGVYGRVAPRSGLAAKKHIDVGAGVIDADYRGNVGVVLFNHASEPFKVENGDRIAQLILEKYLDATVTEVAQLDETVQKSLTCICGRGEGQSRVRAIVVRIDADRKVLPSALQCNRADGTELTERSRSERDVFGELV